MCVKLVKLETLMKVVILVKLVKLVSQSCKQLMPLGAVVTVLIPCLLDVLAGFNVQNIDVHS